MAARTCSCHIHARRAFLRAGVGLGAVAALGPARGWAKEKPVYDSMLLSCIDPRIVDPVFR
jgi:hypothetical protein